MTSSSTPTYFQTMSPAPSSTASASQPTAPQPSALPPSSETSHLPQCEKTTHDATFDSKVKPNRKPLLRLELRDLSDDGTRAFLRLLHATTALEDAVDAVLKQLYIGLKTHCIPPTRSITLVLRSMDGVAYTTGRDIDEDHKEIHLSTNYINHVPDSRKKEEIQGVIVHEMVHCWQHNALGTAPGGLIEGIADWVRLKAGFAPPHWKRSADGDWDAGYERTGFFLEWLEAAHGEEIVRKINDELRGCRYDSDEFWHKCCGKSVGHLWSEYRSSLGDGDSKQTDAKST
ncbi:BSP-domain-containing protein [Paraphaeosphaeria sporulosa]|uniref:BSP-domain-containing protein n=1 Tax=Paraphaeosphaeria sporulosa TaxID=1460663 RepID=A0A177CG85_9PLEO|nr:BSP-domain-containing protein [Paraphaeosphaeria sporulosa]OAG05962.1 BSP-domain-containing protein [Paraphaeosphaeria sporulosa]